MKAVYTYIENGKVEVPVLFGNKPEVEDYIRNLLKNETNVRIDLSPLDQKSDSTHVMVATFDDKTTSDLSEDDKTTSDLSNNNSINEEINDSIIDKYYNKGYTSVRSLFNKLRDEGYDNINREDVDSYFYTKKSEISIESKNQQLQINSQKLGVIGEQTIYDRLRKLFPKLIVESTGKNAHVADIHMTDEKYNIKYVFEIKNKTSLTAEDLNKFERDLLTMKNDKYRIVGIFISLRCTIPRYGNCNIQRDKCYLSEEFTSDENIKLIVEMYKVILKPLPRQEPVEYIIPENIKQLLYQLKSEYKTLSNQKDMYLQQIQFNNQSNENMHKLLSKLELQKHFINFINQEFKDIEDEDTVQETIKDIEEEKLRSYIKATAKSNIRKSDLIEMFPRITKLKTMLLKDIIAEYK